MTTTQEITMPRTSTHPVAVVVFVNAEGADAGDAINVAERAIADAVYGTAPASTGRLVLAAGRTERTVHLGQVVELNRANRNHLIGLATSADAYKV